MTGPAASGRNRNFSATCNPIHCNNSSRVMVTGDRGAIESDDLPNLLGIPQHLDAGASPPTGKRRQPQKRNDACPNEGVVIVENRD